MNEHTLFEHALPVELVELELSQLMMLETFSCMFGCQAANSIHYFVIIIIIITSGVLEHKWRASLKLHYCYSNY